MMGLPQRILPEKTKRSKSRAIVQGISEWMCYYANYGVECPGVLAIDECIEKHVEKGIDQIVWNCGRSVVDYWSDLAHTTEMCEESTVVGGNDWSFVRNVMDRVCPLCRAIEICRRKDIPLLGRLGMNRHYGGEKHAGVTSRFAREHPEWHEKTRPGKRVPGKLCYGIEAVRRERIDILLEIQRVGVDALVLDFCRQIPILLYHESLVEAYMRETAEDPRKILSIEPEEHREWFQWRADILTGFMEELRQEVRDQEKKLGRECQIIARVPDSVEWVNVACGLDVERWCRRDLIDATMLSPFPICIDDPERAPEWHVKTAHRYGKSCIGGIGSLKLIRNGETRNTGFYHPQPVYELAREQYEAGVDAMSLYQSETLVRMDYLSEFLKDLGERSIVAEKARGLPRPKLPEDYMIGMDWHTRQRHSVSVEKAGDDAF